MTSKAASFLTILFSAASFISVLAQPLAIDGYFDAEWSPTSKSNAVYYRTIARINDKFKVRDYFADTDALQMEGTCTSLKPRLVFDGNVKWYYHNGNVQRDAIFQEGEIVGVERAYFEDGTLNYQQVHRNKLVFYYQYNSRMGEPMLHNGNGLIVNTGNDPNNKFNTTYMEVKDSLLTRIYSVLSPADTVYLYADEAAYYRDGMPQFYQNLASEMNGRYPRAARRMGIEGKVFIQFVVDERGAIQESWVLKGIGGGCDEAALLAFNKLAQWEPARHAGTPVKSMHILPVTFRLNR